MKEVPVSSREQKRRMKQVPKYQTLNAILGLADPTEAATKAAYRTRRQARAAETATTTAIDQKVDELRRDPAALIDFLRQTGE